MEFNKLPEEIQFSILEHTDIHSVIKFSQSCENYTKICGSEYEYLWKKLISTYIPTINSNGYKNIGEFNTHNGTQFENWFNVYKYVHKLNSEDLFKECSEGHIDIIKYLIEKGVTENLLDRSLTGACAYGHMETVKYLLQRGANIQAFEDEDEKFAKGHAYGLAGACGSGNLELVKYLVEWGADVEYDNSSTIFGAVDSGNVIL